MTTERLYYGDSHLRTFHARIVETTTAGDRPAVVLDQTAFYPTGGGQPHDTGTLNGVKVTDVFTREGDGAVVHVLAESLHVGPAEGVIAWPRRFDHMQQHTGQHILTQALVQTSGAHTVGFHLSPATVTIDLDRTDLSAAQLEAAEALANQVVWENRPVVARIINPADAEGVRIRRLPDQLHTGGLRVVDVTDFDQTACGGTHVRATGEVGVIKIIRTEKRGDKLRLEFRCGGRALADYTEKNTLANRLTALLTVGLGEVPDAVERTREQLRTAQRDAESLNKRLLQLEAEALAAAAPIPDGIQRIVLVTRDRPAADLRVMAGALAAQPARLILLGAVNGERADVLFARSAELTHDMGALLRETLAALGGKGGGQPALAQGSAPAGYDALKSALAALADRL